MTKRLESSKKTLEKVLAEYEKQQHDITELQRQLDEVTRAQKAFEASLAEIKLISLSEAQNAEYNKRKEKAFMETAKQQQQLTQLTRLQKQDIESRDALEVKRKELHTRMQQLEEAVSQLSERKDKMKAFVEENRKNQEQLKKELEELQESNRVNTERQKELTEALEDIQTQLRAAKSENIQNERDVRFAESVDSLKRYRTADDTTC